MNTDNYQFFANKARRDEIVRQANRQRLISVATRRAAPRAVATGLRMLWYSLFR